MSHKRRLYKPAVQDPVGTKGKRKTLTQGRLITSSIENDDKNQISEPDHSSSYREILANQATGQISASFERSTNGNTNRSVIKSLASKSRREQDGLQTSKIQQGQSQWHPRQEPPHVSVFESPKFARPTRVLDISDSDSYENDTPPGVVFVDASGQTKAGDVSEVNIKMGLEKSPVKVTCHSPSKVQSDLQNTGSVDIGRQVCIDQVPTVSILANEDLSDTDAPKITLHKSPMVIRESTIAGSLIDSSSSAKPVMAKSLFSTLLEEANENPYESSFPLPKVMVDNGGFPLRDNDSVESFDIDGPPAYAMGDLPKDKEESNKHRKAQTSNQLSNAERADKKRKKAPKFVTSRYMQGPPRKGPMKATDRSHITKSSLTVDSSTTRGGSFKRSGSLSMNNSNNVSRHNNDSTSKPSSARKPKNSSLSLPRSGHPNSLTKKNSVRSNKGAEAQPSHTTPETTGLSKSHDRFSSTPSTENSLFSSPGDVDVSAIGPRQAIFHNSGASFHTSPNISTSSPARVGQRNNLVSDKISSNDSMGVARKKSRRVGQWDLELLYARYMQWVFLDSKAKKSFQEQESSAMTLLSGLWEENDKLRRSKSEMDQQLTQLQHLNLLDDALDVQKNGLASVSGALAQVGQQYNTLAKAIDTTRHQVLTHGVYIPPKDDLYDEALVHAFSESEQLLGELSIMIRMQTPKVTDFAHSLEVMEKSISLEVNELTKCQKLMTHAQELTVQEVALAARDIHL